MIFALGFLLAVLLSLLLIPVLSRRAFRLAMQRLQMIVPLSAEEIAAERDHLRADHAVAIRRSEQTVDAARERCAALMSDNGRQAAQIVRLEDELGTAKADAEALRGQLAQTTRDLLEAQGTLGTQTVMLHHSLELAERRLALLNGTAARLATVEGDNDEQRTTIAALETRGTGQDLRLRRALANASDLVDHLDAAKASLADTTRQRDATRVDLALMIAQRDTLLGRLDDLARHLDAERAARAGDRQAIAAMEQRLAIQAETEAGLTARIAERDEHLATLQRLLDDAQSRLEALQAEREQAVLQQRAEPAAPVRDGASLRASIASLAAELILHAERAEATPPAEQATGPERAPTG